MKELSPDQTARLKAAIAAQGALYAQVVVDKTVSPLSNPQTPAPIRRRRR